MTTHIENYGFTKTVIKDNDHKFKNEMKWIGDYDGNVANIRLDIDDNGSKETVSMQLDNDDLMNLLGVQPVEIPLEQRLRRDFLGLEPIQRQNSIVLEGALIRRKKTRKHRRQRKKHNRHKRRSYKI